MCQQLLFDYVHKARTNVDHEKKSRKKKCSIGIQHNLSTKIISWKPYPKVVECQAQDSALVQFGRRRAIGQDFGDLQDGRVESVPTTTLHMVVVLATAADHLKCGATVKAVAVEDVEAVDLVGRLTSFSRRSCRGFGSRGCAR